MEENRELFLYIHRYDRAIRVVVVIVAAILVVVEDDDDVVLVATFFSLLQLDLASSFPWYVAFLEVTANSICMVTIPLLTSLLF